MIRQQTGSRAGEGALKILHPSVYPLNLQFWLSLIKEIK